MLKSKNPVHADELFQKFAEICRKNRTPDGDWQGDGWGAAYLSGNGKWQILKSTGPIWEEKKTLKSLPKSKIFLVHARSASFQNQKYFIDYNQPFISKQYSFVFNGFIKRISFPFSVKGSIGSQKIWYILFDLLKNEPPEKALIRLKNLMVKNSQIVQALNIGLCDGNKLYALCYYSCNPEYYTLWYSKSSSLLLISSNSIPGLDFKPLPSGRVMVL